MTSIGKVSRCDVVLAVQSARDTLVDSFAATGDDRMLIASDDLSSKVRAILVLLFDSITRPERTVLPSPTKV